MVLIKIPDGKAKDMAMTSKVDVKKLQGASEKSESKGPTQEELKAAKKAEKSANAKAAAPAKEKANSKAKGADPVGKPAERPLDDISRLNLRIGKIVKVWEHPESDKLYCEEVDLGEEKPRTIASGLRKFLTLDEMRDQMVVVLANLKPRKMQGFESQGMVMCGTSDDGKVELMQPPQGAQVGERVTVEGVEMLEPDDKLNEKTGKAPLVVLSEGFKVVDRLGTHNGHIGRLRLAPWLVRPLRVAKSVEASARTSTGWRDKMLTSL